MAQARRLELAAKAEAVMASGGDARIVLNRETGLNRYLAAPRPGALLSFSSSTASDISGDAFEHVCQLLARDDVCYSKRLDALRERIARVYTLPAEAEIAFAASGTDLEYVALAAVSGRAGGGVHNVLLGPHEVGSGCILSAHGKYYADSTPREIDVEPGMDVSGFGPVVLASLPLRDETGIPVTSKEMAARIADEIALASAQDRHALVHVVHGSKTGLVLPAMAELAELVKVHSAAATFVVDACQARLDEGVVSAYLELGCMVLVTGSKFIGGPPFSGFAICPREMVENAAPLPHGLGNVFCRAEWPAHWAGGALLPEEENVGLALRLEAAVFELERFHALEPSVRDAVIKRFQPLVRELLLDPLEIDQVDRGEQEIAPASALQTMATLDLSSRESEFCFAKAGILQRALLEEGIRLGQPVRCLRLDSGNWSGNLRVSLSMPQIVALADEDSGDRSCTLSHELRQIAEVLERLP